MPGIWYCPNIYLVGSDSICKRTADSLLNANLFAKNTHRRVTQIFDLNINLIPEDRYPDNQSPSACPASDATL